jgi:hypothetical protein
MMTLEPFLNCFYIYSKLEAKAKLKIPLKGQSRKGQSRKG